MSRNHSSVAWHSLWMPALCAAVLLSASTPILATTAAGNEGYDTNVDDVLSNRRCKLAAKQERCDWVKRGHAFGAVAAARPHLILIPPHTLTAAGQAAGS